MGKGRIEAYIHPSAIVDPSTTLGSGTKVWHFSHLMSSVKVGEDCTIGQNCFVASNVVIGNRVKIQNNVSLYEGLTCEDEVFIGPSAVFTNVINPRSTVNRRGEFKETKILRGATIGANATIVCGITIGEYSFVSAGAVVTQDVPAFTLVKGVPAKPSSFRSRNGWKLRFDKNGEACVNDEESRYQLNKTGLIKELR